MKIISGISFLSHTRSVDASRVLSRDVAYQRGKTQLANWELLSLSGAFYRLMWHLAQSFVSFD